MVSAKWTSPACASATGTGEQSRRTVNLGGTAGRVSASRPNVDGSFVFRN